MESHAVHLSLRREGIGRREGKEKWWHCVIVVCMGERYRKRRLPYYAQERKERHFWYIYTHTRSVDLSLCIFTSYQAVVVCCCCISGCDRSLDSWLKAHSDSITDLFLLCLFLFSSSNVLIRFSLLCVVYLFSFFLSLYTDVHYMRLIFTKCHLSYILFFLFFFLPLIPFLTDHREKHEDWMQMPRRVRFVFHLRTVEFSFIFSIYPYETYGSVWYHRNEFWNFFFVWLIIIFRFMWAAYLLEGHAIFPRGEWRSPQPTWV